MKKLFTLLAGILLISLNLPALANQNGTLEPGFSASDFSKFIFHENFDSPVFPPPGYASNIISGLGNWEWSDQGKFPEAFPQDGHGLISYESFLWDAGSSAVLITPQINVPAANYRIRFSMYRDSSSPGVLDRLEVLANDKNNNVSTATTLGVVHRHIAASPGVPEEGWYYFDFPVGMSGNVHFFFKAISQNGANIHLDAFFVELVPAGLPSLGVIPTAIDFGPVPVGYEPDGKEVKLWNIGDGTLTINQGDIAISGPNADEFSLSGGVFPIQLQKYQSFTLQMNFTAASAGAKNANLTVNHNGSNNPTSVSITAECYIPLANFFENFDGVVAPFLPPIWNKIVQSTSDNAFLGTFVDATPASSPNHVRMFNSNDNAAQLLLVTPAVSGFADNWLGFKAKTFSSNQLLKIGTLADPRNHETFEEIDRVIVPAGTYTQFYIPFTDYAGSNQFLALLHGLGGTNRSIYIDDVVWEAMPVDPVFSVSPASNDFGPVLIGATSPAQSFTIRNVGGGILIINPTDITLTGANAGDFILHNLGTSVELTYNQTATFSVSFAPGSQGTKQASIFINDNISDTPQEIPLSGFAFSNLVETFPWKETFEDNSTTRPAWTQIREVGSAFWTYAAGSTSTIGGGNITTAYAGELNARFVSVTGTNSPITKLITPILDLTGTADPGIVFYLGQQSLSGAQNQTKVYYRTSATDPWVQLAHYTENISAWTRQYLDLPNSSSTYQVAFEGINNRGRANVLDEVSVCPELLPVSVSITADLNEVCQGTMVTFTASPTNAGASPLYQWIVNGNNTGPNNPVFSYIPAIGDQVSLVLTSGEECVINNVAESNIINMEVYPVLPVSVTILADQTEVCEGAMVSLTASPVNGGLSPSYQWKLNGGNAGTNSAVFSFIPANGDQVAVVLTSSEHCTSGNPATSNLVSLTVAPLMPVSVSIVASQNEVCQGSQVTFTATPFNGGTTPHYQWKVNGNNTGQNSPTFSYTPSHGDEVWVILTSNSACATGNPATSNIIVMTVNPLLPVSVSIEADQTEVCQGTSVNFTASPVNGGVNPHYQWQVNGSNYGSNSQVFSYAPAHGDQVTVILTSTAVCPSGSPATSNPVYIIVNPLLPVSVSISATQTEVCEGTPVTFTATAMNGGNNPGYQWRVNGSNVGISNPQYTYTSLDGDQVSVVLTSSEVCATGNPATSNIIPMMVYPLLPVSLSIAADQTEVCQGTVVTFTATPVNGGFSPFYQWKVNGVNSGINNQIFSYTPSHTDLVTVEMTSSVLCPVGSPATSNVVSLTVNPLLPVSVSIVADQAVVCDGTPVTFTASAVNAGSDPVYQWKVNGVNHGVNSAVFSHTPANNDQVVVVLTSSAACATNNPATSNAISITVNPLLNVSVSITADETEICQGTFVTFTADPVNGGNNPTYQWRVNSVNMGSNSRTFIYAPAHGDEVSVVMTSNAVCPVGSPAASNIISMVVNPLLPVSVSIHADQTEVCTGTPVTLTATALNAGSNPTYQWKLNGVNTGLNSPAYTYTPLHNDQVSVVVTSSEICATGSPATSNFITLTVYPLLPVSASITASQAQVCAGTQVTFTATAVNGGSSPTYQWKVNGSNMGSNSPNFTYIPVDGDQVSVVLTSSELCVTGNPATSSAITIVVNPLLPVSVSIASSANNVCAGTAVTFTATSVNGGSSPIYQWKVNGSNMGSNSPSFTYVPLDGDQVSVVLTSSELCVTGNPATSNTITMAVNPLLPVSVSIAASANNVCAGIAVTFTATAVNGGSSPAYQWKVNGSNAGTGSPNFTYIPVDGDQVSVVLTSSELCVTGNPATSNVITIVVNPLLPVSVSIAASENNVCAGTPITFTATAVNGGISPAYQWKVNGSIMGANSPNFTYTPVDDDQVSVVVTSSELCVTGNPATSNVITMAVNPLLPVSVSIGASENNVCAGIPVTFTATPVNGGISPSYQWKVNGANAGAISPQFTYTPLHGDQVQVVLTSSETCTSGSPANSGIIAMTVYANPVVSWNWTPEPVYPWDDPVVLSGGLPAGGQYSGTGVSDNIFYPLVAGPGTHVLTYTFVNLNGCSGSATTTIVVLEAPDCNAPTNLLAGNITLNSAQLSWVPGNVEQEWHLEWGPSGFAHGSGTLVSGLTNAQYSLSGLAEATAYQFYVRAVCGGGVTSGWAGPYNFSTLFNLVCPENISVCELEIPFALGGGIPAGGTYTGSGVIDGIFDPALAGAGNHTITYTYQGEICQFTITVQQALPVSVSITASQAQVCAGTQVTFTATAVNGGSSPTYQWKVNGSNMGSNSPNFTYIPVDGDQVSVVLTSSELCVTGNPATSSAITIVVNPLLPVSVSIASSANNVCAGTAVTFTATSVNGGSSPIYQWKVNGSNMGSNSPSFTYVPLHGDQVMVIMTSSESCITGNPANSNLLVMTVYANPIVSWPWTHDPVYPSDDPILLSGGMPSGGQYSGPGVTGNIFYPLVAGPGVHLLTYTYVNAFGCAGAATALVEVLETPDCVSPTDLAATEVTTSSALLSWVAGNTEQEWQLEWGPSGFAHGSGTLVSGFSAMQYSLSGLEEATSYQFFVRAVCAGGITSSWAGPLVFTTEQTQIDIVCPDDLTVCENEPAFELTGASPAGGIFSGNGVTANLFDPTTAGPGTNTITYSYMGESCQFLIIVQPTITASVSLTANQTEVCQDVMVSFTATTVNGGSNPAYQWRVNNSAAGSNSSEFSYVPVHLDQVWVVMNSDAECVAENPVTSNVVTITVNDLPIVSWDWNPEPVVADSDPIVLTGGTPAGGLYSGPGVFNNIFEPQNAGPGLHILTYTYVDGNGCAGSANASVEVLESPDCGPPTNLIVGGITANLAQLSWTAGNNHEEWLLEWGLAGFTPGNGNLVSGLLTPGYELDGLAEETAYEFYVRGICTAGVTSAWAGPAGFTTLSSQVEVICPDNVVLCIADPVFELTGASPEGGVFSGLGVSGAIFDPVLAGEGLHVITYSYEGQSCEFQITVQPLLEAGVNISAELTSACHGLPVTFTATAVNGGTTPVYQWMVNSVNAGSNSHEFTYVPANGDQVSVEMTSSESCIAQNPVTSNTITISLQPNLPVTVHIIGGVTEVCEGITIYFYAFPVNGGTEPSYQWLLNDEPFGLNSPVLSFVPTNGDRVKVVMTSSETCTTGNPAISNEFVITVNPKPSVVWDWEFESVCSQTPSIPLSGAYPEGGVFSGPGVMDDSFVPSMAGPGTHTLCYIYFDDEGCYNIARVEIEVFDCTGINQPDEPGDLLLYPNPARNQINMVLSKDFTQLIEILIFDMHGNLVIAEDNPEPRETYVFDIRHLPRGIYFVIVRGSKGILGRKFVVM